MAKRLAKAHFIVLFILCILLSGCSFVDQASAQQNTQAGSSSNWGASMDQTATTTPSLSSSSAPPAPNITTSGKVILVSLSKQWLWAYTNKVAIFNTPVTTGQPGLETPTGTYPVLSKVRNKVFISPWPQGDPNYYSPEQTNYALYFLDGGFYIHDAPWRKVFGPGSNVPHTAPDGTKETGSHGCVNVPTSAGAWLYDFAPVNTTIIITD
jgi:lipoprotein-anchoring transpeptidase ErfK/SrfK